MPPPAGDPDAPLRALIFDSHYDPFRGTIVYIRVFDGGLQAGDIIRFMCNDATYKVEEVGFFRLSQIREGTVAGQVGYLIAGIKTVSDTRCGDTVTLNEHPRQETLRLQGSQAGGLLIHLSGGSRDYLELATASKNSN